VVLVPAFDEAAHKPVKPISVRRQVDHKILRFSLLIGAIAACLVAFVYLASIYPLLRRAVKTNARALSEITCAQTVCDTKEFLEDWQSESPDYIVDKQTGYIINAPSFTWQEPGRFARLDYSDATFVARFRQPVSYTTLDGEVWRLYSRPVAVADQKVDVIVGYREAAPTTLAGIPNSEIGNVDAQLKREADSIAMSLSSKPLILPGPRTLSADGFEMIDSNTNQVLIWGPWIPAFLPKGTRMPNTGCQFNLDNSILYLAQTDSNGRLLATSLIQVGDVSLLAAAFGFSFFAASTAAHALSRRFLRGYFAVRGVQVPTLEEAQRTGEGQSVEFKRGLSDDESRGDELLKSIAAFANTNDGVVFIGVDDAGHVKGLTLDFKQKDRFERKVRQLVRNHIRPIPPIQVDFEDVRGLVVARIVVARGEAPVYMIGGVIYVRDGSSDFQAQPEDLSRLVLGYV
jgi:hypothetical protein